MIKFDGKTYYFDLKVLYELLTIPTGGTKEIVETTTTDYDDNEKMVSKKIVKQSHFITLEIDSVKYDMYQNLIDMVLDCTDELDTTLGAERAFADTSIGFKLAFNTLLKDNIIKTK